jgi:hypothetical protein
VAKIVKMEVGYPGFLDRLRERFLQLVGLDHAPNRGHDL